MIHEENCTYEVCKLAKEKGFDVPTFGYYRIDTEDWYRTDVYGDWNDSTIRYSAPTQSLLQRWLREEKKIEVYVRNFENTIEFPHHYWNLITDSNGKTLKIGDKMFDTYELALEDALKYALENLI